LESSASLSIQLPRYDRGRGLPQFKSTPAPPSHAPFPSRCYIAGMRCLTYLLLSCYSLQAQPPAYEYTGSPLVISYTCTEDDIDWAGLTCVDEPCPIYIDLTHAAGQGKSILITGNFHASAVTMYSVLLRSEDSGRTWREPIERIRGAELDAIQVYDGHTAWIAGLTLQPVAVDPFFLITDDGGATWIRVPLFEEGTEGTVLQYIFDSKDHGLALVDRGGGELRYETYETQTGGHTWSLLEKSAKFTKLKRVPESDWRIRAESRVFRLEHLEEEHWSPFASFAIRSAECRRKQLEAEPAAEVAPELKPAVKP